MQDLIWALVGFAIPFVVGWALAKVKPHTVAKWLSKVLEKVLKDERALDKVEDEIGKKLIDIGKAIVERHRIGEEPDINPSRDR